MSRRTRPHLVTVVRAAEKLSESCVIDALLAGIRLVDQGLPRGEATVPHHCGLVHDCVSSCISGEARAIVEHAKEDVGSGDVACLTCDNGSGHTAKEASRRSART